MKKRLAALALCILVFVSTVIPVSADHADTTYEESLAFTLKNLGLFRGVSDTEFDLNREPSRVEALVMLIRLLGKEHDALSYTWTHPFNDVPAWADQYVGYAYENGLTNGISSTQFGTGNASAAMYLTFVLRALGYSDANAEDFSWDTPYELAYNVGVLPSTVNISEFWRADVVSVSHAAMNALTKGSSSTLADTLIAAGVFSAEDFEYYYNNNFIPTYPTDSPEEIPDRTHIAEQEELYSENYHGHVYTGGSSSKRYHFEAECAGKYSHEITWDEVERRGLTPCETCVLN